MSRVLVTGGTGFVGQALVAELTRHGFQVRVALRRDAPLLPDVEYTMTGAVGPETDWHAALIGVSAVVHLAALAHIADDGSVAALDRFRSINAAGTARLAAGAAAAGVGRFVYLSSVGAMAASSAPGRPLNVADPPHPVGSYGLSKLEGEQALHRIATDSGMAVIVVRAPLVYGAGVKGNFLRLLQIVDRGLPLPFGAVDNRRSLVHVANLVDLLHRCLAAPMATAGTFLVSDGEDLSTAGLIRRLSRALGRPARLPAVPVAALRLAGRLSGRRELLRQLLDDCAIDIAATRLRFGWSPPITVDAGLAATAEWYHRRNLA